MPHLPHAGGDAAGPIVHGAYPAAPAPVTVQVSFERRRFGFRYPVSANAAAPAAVAELHIGATVPLAAKILPDLLARFCPCYPQVKAFSLFGDEPEILELLLEGRIQLGLFPGASWLGGFQIQPLVVQGPGLPRVLYFAHNQTASPAARAFVRTATLGPPPRFRQ